MFAPATAPRALTFLLTGKEIWVANAQDNTATIINVASKSVSQNVPISVKGANRLKITPDGKYALISGLGAGRGSSASASDLVVLDVATRKEVKQLKLGEVRGYPCRTRWRARFHRCKRRRQNRGPGFEKTLAVTGYFTAGKQPDGMAWAVRK